MNNIEKTIWSEKIIQTLDSGILVFDSKSYRLIMINDEAKRIFDCADEDSSKIMHIIASMLPEEERATSRQRPIRRQHLCSHSAIRTAPSRWIPLSPVRFRSRRLLPDGLWKRANSTSY